MAHHIVIRNAKCVVIFVSLMLVCIISTRFNRAMLNPEQEAYVAIAAHRLADSRATGKPVHDVVRTQLLEASDGNAIRTEWGTILPSAEVSFELLDQLARLSPVIARLSIKMTIDEDQGCWALPYDARGKRQYPIVYDRENKKPGVLAHRYVWKTLIDPAITRTDWLDHLCRAHACCNPSHLETVTPSTNTKRGNDARHILGGQDVLFHTD